jgi:hypothetical protein
VVTATTNPQEILNQEAAAAFRSVILSSFADNSCSSGNSTRHFTPGETVYVDLCSGAVPLPGSITVTIDQGGTVLYTMTNPPLNMGPNSSFYLYRYGLPSGTYAIVVTMPIHGKVAVARDLSFTIS